MPWGGSWLPVTLGFTLPIKGPLPSKPHPHPGRGCRGDELSSAHLAQRREAVGREESNSCPLNRAASPVGRWHIPCPMERGHRPSTMGLGTRRVPWDIGTRHPLWDLAHAVSCGTLAHTYQRMLSPHPQAQVGPGWWPWAGGLPTLDLVSLISVLPEGEALSLGLTAWARRARCSIKWHGGTTAPFPAFLPVSGEGWGRLAMSSGALLLWGVQRFPAQPRKGAGPVGLSHHRLFSLPSFS